MIFAVVEGFGDLEKRSECWDEETVELFDNEAEAVAFAEIRYDSRTENMIDLFSFLVIVTGKLIFCPFSNVF